MSLRFDLYVERSSWLHRLDPRSKLALVGALVLLLLLYHNLWLISAFLLLTHLVLLSAHVPWGRLAGLWRAMLPISALIVVLWPLFHSPPGPALLEIWRLRVTALGLAEGLAMGLRVVALAFALFALLLSTEQARLVRGLVKLGLPYAWGLSLAIALRYLPTFYGTFTMISEAQQARGLVVGRGGLLARARSYMPVLVAMIITALRMMDNLSLALEARGFGATPRRTYLRDLRFSASDWLLLAVVSAGFAALLAARLWYGVGAHPVAI